MGLQESSVSPQRDANSLEKAATKQKASQKEDSDEETDSLEGFKHEIQKKQTFAMRLYTDFLLLLMR